jgi:ATP-dependent Lhr-like helicase
MTQVVELIRERFRDLTEIQKIAIPKILNGSHVLVLAPTGYGKTEAALLPILEKIKNREGGIHALYITPLRALNRDLLKRFSWWCERLNISYSIRHGDSTVWERTKQRKKPPQILLITCETLQALFMGKIMRKHLSNVGFVIVDEIHDILDNKRGAQLSLALERLEEIAPNFQRIGLTATLGNEEEAARLIFGFRPYEIAEVEKNRKMNIEIKFLKKQEERIEEIKKTVEANRSLVFVNTRSTAEELGATLKEMNAPVEIHHGSLSKDIRIAAEEKFKSGEIKSLVATSSLELGIDIGDVELVIQYGSPHQINRLIQRVGRSGHALGKTPRGFILPTDFDDALESEVIVLLAKNGWIEKKHVEKGALDVIAHQLVGLCFDKGKVTLKDAHSILSRSYAYAISFSKLKLIALQLYSEGLIFYDEIEDGNNANIKNTRRAREYYYSNLTTIPKEKCYLLRDTVSNKVIAQLDERFVLNLEQNATFLSKGQPWTVVDITEDEVLAQPASAFDVIVPAWIGEEVPVEFEIAQKVGQLRAAHKEKADPLPDDRTIIIEIIDDLVVVHGCFGTRVNEALGRLFSYNLSKIIGESVRVVTDPYRIMLKLPFPLAEAYLLRAFKDIKNPRSKLISSLENSFLLKMKFTHVARLFGLFDESATATWRFIDMLKNSVVYEETIRSILSKFDMEHLEHVVEKIEKNEIKIVVDKRKEPSFFAKLGIEKISGGEAVGIFEPREMMIKALKEKALTTTFELKCLNCKATRFLNLAGVKEGDRIKCHNCGEQALTITDKLKKLSCEEEMHVAALIRNYGRRALIALATYGIGPQTADRILKKLHHDENAFYIDLLEAQRNFIKTKKYWKI